MDLQNLMVDRAATKATFMGETLHFKYRPALITAEAFSKLEDMGEVKELTEFFAEIIVSWDLTKGDVPVEVTPEAFTTLPMQLLRSIVKAITDDVPQSEQGKVSPAG